MPSREELHALLPKIVNPTYLQDVREAILPSVRLYTDKLIEPTVGGTKLGGLSHFHPGQKWPINEAGNPMTFTAQINLKEVAPYAELLMAPSGPNAIHEIFADDFWQDTDYFEKLEEGSDHHLLGHYQGIQHNGYETELIKTGKGPYKRQTIEDLKAATEWLLLFQLDSDNALDFSIGDWGRAYFFIHQDDLQARRFDRVRIIGDCY